MTTRNENLQRVWHQFVDARGGSPASPREVVHWAIAAGVLAPPDVDPEALLANEMARALREEFKTAPDGRRYRANHSVRITRDGVQMSLWAEMGKAPHEHMVKAFAGRRRQIVGDCIQLKTDVDVYNDTHRSPDKPMIQMVLDFTDDVAEVQSLNGFGGVDEAC